MHVACPCAQAGSATKPGWTRVNLHWVFSPEQVDYVVQAVAFVARHGWKFLCYYQFGTRSPPPGALAL
jgi:hypothetical protein